jgi:hypothetical protein
MPRLAALLFFTAPALAAGPNLGQPLTHADLAAWELHVYPNGKGLPPGSGTMAQGAPIYAQKCAHCHGEQGKGGRRPRFSPHGFSPVWRFAMTTAPCARSDNHRLPDAAGGAGGRCRRPGKPGTRRGE